MHPKCLRPLSKTAAGLLALVSAVATAGCARPAQPAGTPVEQAWENQVVPPARDPATAVAADSPVTTGPADAADLVEADGIVAVVNGTPIARRRMVRMLVEGHGLALLQQMILLAAAQQKAAELNLQVTAADVAAAHEDALRRISMPIAAQAAPLDRPAAERLLDEFLAAKNISRGEWDLRMQQRAYLRKLAEAEIEKVALTDVMLREEYLLTYGERVQVRHIQVPSLAAVDRVRAALTEGRDFAAVARELSENQVTGANGGLMPPFTRNDTAVPPLLREAAFALRAGEPSAPVQVDSWFHILKLERRFPASEVKYENADREALRRRLTDRLVRQRQETLEEELFRAATVDIRDETLRKQFAERFRR